MLFGMDNLVVDVAVLMEICSRYLVVDDDVFAVAAANAVRDCERDDDVV